ncbi:MAG: hypothetical protein WCC14_22245, partial [Acidobacteriaceae bacterium]
SSPDGNTTSRTSSASSTLPAFTCCSDIYETTSSVREQFEFLGIEFCNGLIRPAKRKRAEHLESIRATLEGAKSALFGYKADRKIDRKFALLKSLIKVSDTMHSWGMHYRFCNDSNCLAQLDMEAALLIDDYLGTFRSIRRDLGPASMWDLLGIQSLQKIERDSLAWVWPTSGSKSQRGDAGTAPAFGVVPALALGPMNAASGAGALAGPTPGPKPTFQERAH